jgi:hypothetical protein
VEEVMSSANAIPVVAPKRAITTAEPTAAMTFEVRSSKGALLATTDSEDLAMQDAHYRVHERGHEGVEVQRVTVITEREVIYRPKVRVAA